MTRRHPIPPGATRIAIGWETPEGEPMRVEGYLLPGSPEVHYQRNGDPGWPAEPPEFCLLTIIEDRPGGKERPELLPLAEQDLDRLTTEAEEAVADRWAAAEEDWADRRYEESRERED